MESNRFDALAKTLIAGTNRRRTLSGLLGGTLGLLGLAASEEAWSAKSGRCKPKCDECEKCKKGDCEKKNGRKVCKKGKCKPKPNGTACGNTGVCQSGRCVCPSGTEECRGACVALCPEGQVRNPDTCGCCTPRSGSCAPTGENADCCAGFCGFPGICAGLPAGRSCSFDAQCQSGVCNNQGTCT